MTRCRPAFFMALTTYTTAAKLNEYLSAAGIISYADHDEDGTSDTGVITNAIEDATEEIREKYPDVENVELECGECLLKIETDMETACPEWDQECKERQGKA